MSNGRKKASLPDGTRRTFLKVMAATGATAGIATKSTAQERDDNTFEFLGHITEWHGISPESVAEESNPTLELEPGETYRVVWENGDGLPHNFVIVDDAGREVVRSPVVAKKGVTQTVEFEATEEMAEYLCEFHPRRMRGEIRPGGEEPADTQEEEVVPSGDSVALETIAEGFASPLGFEVAPESKDRRFIVDQTGQIHVHDEDGLREEPFLDIGDRLVELGDPELGGYDERGLLGLAFHPEFEENRQFYVHYSAPNREGTPDQYDHTEVIAELRATEDLSKGDRDSERPVLEIPSPQMNHNGAQIAFGPDGYLYVPVGDGGDADDTGPGHVDDWYDENEGGNGQDTTENLLGGILRIDVDDEGDDTPYAIPDDNPLVDEDDHLDEYYAWGFRNPHHLSFDGEGRLFVADAGQNLFEEVNLVEKDGNYGWNVKEATHCFSTETPNVPSEDCPDSTPEDVRGGEPLLDPIIEYPHREATTAMIDGSVVMGGFVYEGGEIDHLRDKYVFGNWSAKGVVEPEGQIFVATPPDHEDAEGSSHGFRAIQAETIRLGGEVQAWRGETPSDIEGDQNPTLTLVAGETYELTWENLDGAQHNFVIETEDGEHLVETEIIEGEGETQTVEFEATEEMAEYYCEVHPDTMRGSIEIDEEEEPDEAEEEEEPDEAEEEEEPEEAEEEAVGEKETEDPDEREPDPAGDHEMWSIEELVVEGGEDERLEGYLYGFGNGTDDELYVLTSENPKPFGDTGKVHRIIPPGVEDGGEESAGESNGDAE